VSDLREKRLARFADLLGRPELRRRITRDRPDLFALLYFPHHLRSEATGGVITFSEVHEEWCREAVRWIRPLGGPQENRDAYVAPRETGKSTWMFLILPAWAAAHGHVRFAAAFADSATQAETHLRTLKHEFDSNRLLREDFPDLVTPARRPRGAQVADNAGMLVSKSGFVFAARGIDAGNLGIKVGELRPDLLVLDDVEPGESNYSAYQMKKRLGTIRDVIFPLNVNARVVIVGTVTMPGSIIHQLVRSVRGEADPEEWIAEERIRVHYYPAIVTEDDGSRRSIWPARWPLEFLTSIEHTRTYAKNYANDPMGLDGAYWSVEDFRYGDLRGITRRILSIDPSVTTKKTSDPTGLAIVSWSPMERKVLVEKAWSVRLTGRPLRDHLIRETERAELDGRPILGWYVETNQGGDLWEKEVFHDAPVKVKTVHQSVAKEIRAAEALAHYQRGRVLHLERLASAEEQMVAFPSAPHDDEVDAIGAGVNLFLSPAPVKKSGVKVASYV
jgi:phage terminase large subunit-like protein